MTSKFKNTFEGMEIPSLKNCNLCSHQPVCIAFSLFKQSIEPNIMDPESGLKARTSLEFVNCMKKRD